MQSFMGDVFTVESLSSAFDPLFDCTHIFAVFDSLFQNSPYFCFGYCRFGSKVTLKGNLQNWETGGKRNVFGECAVET